MPSPKMNYEQSVVLSNYFREANNCYLNKCVLMPKFVHGKGPWYVKDLLISSERLHVHGNKQLVFPGQEFIFLKLVTPFQTL